MTCYVGLDVSVETTSVCILDADGVVLREAKIATDPAGLATYLLAQGHTYSRVGLEAWALAGWIYGGLVEAGLPAICIDARHAHGVLKARLNKTDRNDARGIADIMRVGLYRIVHVKSQASARCLALVTARRLLQTKLIDLENGISGMIRAYGMKVRKVRRGGYEEHIRSLVADDPAIGALIEILLRACSALRGQFNALNQQVEAEAKSDPICRRLMTAPGVGPLVALLYRSVIDEPARFKSSRTVGAHLGLTPRGFQSGVMERRGRITKCGDKSLRSALFLAAQVILYRSGKPSALRDWGVALVERRGSMKARVAVARRLACILHRMWLDGADFRFEPSTT